MNKNKHRLYALSLFFLIALNLANSILTVQVVQNLSCHANYLSINIYNYDSEVSDRTIKVAVFSL
jgi:hypothetical protein